MVLGIRQSQPHAFTSIVDSSSSEEVAIFLSSLANMPRIVTQGSQDQAQEPSDRTSTAIEVHRLPNKGDVSVVAMMAMRLRDC